MFTIYYEFRFSNELSIKKEFLSLFFKNLNFSGAKESSDTLLKLHKIQRKHRELFSTDHKIESKKNTNMKGPELPNHTAGHMKSMCIHVRPVNIYEKVEHKQPSIKRTEDLWMLLLDMDRIVCMPPFPLPRRIPVLISLQNC